MPTLPLIARKFVGDLHRGDLPVAAGAEGVILVHGRVPAFALISVGLPVAAARRLVGVPLTLWCRRGPILWVEARLARRGPSGGTVLNAVVEGEAFGVPLEALEAVPMEPRDG